jgi:hypothetical protein
MDIYHLMHYFDAIQSNNPSFEYDKVKRALGGVVKWNWYIIWMTMLSLRFMDGAAKMHQLVLTRKDIKSELKALLIAHAKQCEEE